MRVEALRRVGVQSDVQRVRVVKHLQVFEGWGGPWRGERAVPALVARYFVVSRAAARTLPRPGEDAVCLALLDQAYPLRTAHHLARKHPVRFVMLVVYAAGLLFIFLMRRQD